MLLYIPLHLEIIIFCGTSMQYSIKLFGKLSFNLKVPGIIGQPSYIISYF